MRSDMNNASIAQSVHGKDVSARRVFGAICVCALACVLVLSLVPSAAFAAVGDAAQAALEDAESAARDEAESLIVPDEDPSTPILALAAGDEEEEVFQETVNGVDMWFTVVSNDEDEDGNAAPLQVAVGRSNTLNKTDYAIDVDYKGAVSIPDTVAHEGTTYTVCAIQDYAFSTGGTSGCTLSSVIIAASIAEIGRAAFMSCDSLTSVNFADQSVLTAIGTSAFQRCFALESFSVPVSVTEINSQAFAYCTALSSLTFADDSQIETIGMGAFQGNKSMPGALIEFAFPAVDTISTNVCTYQTSLVNLTFADTDYGCIEDSAFTYCTALEEVAIPHLKGIPGFEMTIGSNMMSYCTSLKTIKFVGDASGYRTKNLGNYSPFYGCESIENVVYYGKSWYGDDAFGLRDDDTGLFPNPENISFYYNVTFYEDRSDAEQAINEIGSVRVRKDVTVAQIRENSFEEGQIFNDGGFVPNIDSTWAFEDDLQNDDVISDSCWAYRASMQDIAGAVITLNQMRWFATGDPIDISWTVVLYTGEVLTEGVDYTVSVFLNGEEQNIHSLTEPGTYELIFTGMRSYTGTQTLTFLILEPGVDWSSVSGTTSIEVAAASCADLYSDSVDRMIVVGAGDQKSAVEALPLAGIFDIPILVTLSDELSEDVAVQVRRLSPSQVIVVGDTSSVSSDVYNAIGNLRGNPSVLRITPNNDAGAALYSTYKEDFDSPDVAYLVLSDDATYGATVGAQAYRESAPLFFCEEDGTLDGSVRSALKTGGFSEVVLVNGTETSCDRVKAQVGNNYITYTLLSGSIEDITLEDATTEAAQLREFSFVYGPSTEAGAIDAAVAAQYAAKTDAVFFLSSDVSSAQASVDEIVSDAVMYTDSLEFVGQRSNLPQTVVDTVCAAWYGQRDTTELAEVVARAEGLTRAKFTSDTWETLSGVFDNAKACLADGSVSQDGIDEATAALRSAIAALEVNPDYITEFPDVTDSEAYFYDSVYYLSSLGIMTGYATGEFGLGATLTRAELATIMWRIARPVEAIGYANSFDVGVEKLAGARTLPDGSKIRGIEDEAWYTGAANWAVNSGVITGYLRADGTYDFAPNDPVTFEQMTTIVARYATGGAAEDTSSAILNTGRYSDGTTVSDWARGCMTWCINEGLVTGYLLDSGKYQLAPAENVARERAATVTARAIRTELI